MGEQYVIAGIYGKRGSLENQPSDGLTDLLNSVINNIDVLTCIITHKYVKTDVLKNIKDYEFLEFFRELLYIKFVINKNKKYETELF